MEAFIINILFLLLYLPLPPKMESEVTGNEKTSANGHAIDDEAQVLKRTTKEVENRALPQDTNGLDIDALLAKELNQMSFKDRGR
jgi:hypothetical protein